MNAEEQSYENHREYVSSIISQEKAGYNVIVTEI
jgi:hypothetical protein